MPVTDGNHPLSLNEAACVAGVPLKAVRRIIDSGLLQGAVKKRKGRRTIQVTALAGLKLAWETAGILTLEGRRRLVRRALDAPESETVRENSVSIDLRAIKNDVERGLANLEEAGKMVIIDNGIRGGAPCFRDTRIPVHMIAEMFANGDSAADLAEAYPTISEEHVHAARIYAQAYPRRDPPHGGPSWRRQKPRSSIRIPFNKLPRVS